MSPLVERLVALSFSRADPATANTAIEAARLARSEYQEAVSYEVALPALAPDEFLMTKALPKLVYFLDCRGTKPPSSGAVFVSLFCAEGLFFIEAGPLVQLLTEARGLTLYEVVRRYGQDGAGDPALLGP